MPASPNRLVSVVLDEQSGVRYAPLISRERETAIRDLLDCNSFAPKGTDALGPYRLLVSRTENRILFDVQTQNGEPVVTIPVSFRSFARHIKDYFFICDNYFNRLDNRSVSQIEALDMGRKAAHDEAAILLQDKLSQNIEMDFDTARRLFTLVCVLHIGGRMLRP